MTEAIQVLSVSEQHICDGEMNGKPCPWVGHAWNRESQPIQGQVVDIFEQIELMIQGILTRENQLDHGYAHLGGLLVQVSEQELWREAGFKSFDKYLEQLSEKYHRGRTQLYAYFSSVREMRPYLSETQMNEIGISKLNVLKGATKKLGFPPNNEVIDVALDANSTVSDVKKKIAQEHQFTEEEQQDTQWFELPGFFATKEQILVITSALEASWRTDPVVQKSVKPGIRALEALLRFSMEYLSTHGESAETGEA